MKAFNLLKYGLVFYFLIPYILFFRFSQIGFALDYAEIFWAFKNSFVQSFAAAIIITLLSVPFSLALFGLNKRASGILLKLLLVPQVLPSFFSILIAFSIWKPFPVGTIGISFIFIMVHLGFAVTLLYSAARLKLGPFPIVAEVFGLGRRSFFSGIYFPLLKTDLFSIFLLVFIFCFSSFSVPLVAGGGRDTNIEVLIYEKIFINQNWSSAWMLSIFQSVFLTSLSIALMQKKHFEAKEFSNVNTLKSSFGLFGIGLYLILYATGYLTGFFQALPEFGKLGPFYPDLIAATVKSLQLLFIYAALMFVLLYLWLYDFTLRRQLGFSRHLIAASTMLVGFSFYLLFPQSEAWDHFKIPFAMSILIFPVLFKSFLEKAVLDLKDQVITAQVFGIRSSKIIFEVLIARLARPITIWFSFLSIWFLSDFALLRALGTQTKTLGLLAEDFLSSYRLSLAYGLSVYILFIWVLVLLFFFIMKGAVRVGYQKFKS